MKIAINTGGGDAPGLNAVIHSATYAAISLGWEIYGIRDGYNGLMDPDDYQSGGLIKLDRRSVKNIASLGGTILGTVNKSNPFKRVVTLPDGTKAERDESDRLVKLYHEHGFDALIAVGGDGSLGLAHALQKKGIRVVGVPKTIDNDLRSTNVTFGFNSAVEFATECIDRLHSTAQSHRRLIVVEVMGRNAGWIALHSGLAGEADAILLPEIPFDLNKVAAHIKSKRKRSYAIVVAAEGAYPLGGEVSVKSKELGRAEILGGIGEYVAAELQELAGMETRSVVLGHLLRGGSPTALDRMLGLVSGAAAVRALEQGLSDVMVSLQPPRIEYVPLEEAVRDIKRVPVDSEAIITARTLGISLGD